MLKRGNPFTPSPAVTGKKTREYNSPLRTPLRNVTGKNDKDEPQTPLNDDDGERRRNRAAMVQNRRQAKKELMSPAIGTPKANPPSILTPKAGTPLTPSVIMTDLANKPMAAPKLTVEQRNKMFEEWMKIAADNKINAKNSWNVALIDYFSELTFLRDGDSINFQRASCTLDGCVKIYATRVDSVADETGKLLNGLAEGGKSTNPSISFYLLESRTDFLAEPTGDNDQGDESKKPKSTKRPSRAVDTLERSFEALNLKNFELEFAVDPLFRKMCAEFDENGTRGFLTSSLNLDESGRMMFDSSEAANLFDELPRQELEEDNSMINISKLLESHGRHLADLNTKTVIPSLVEYSFGSMDLVKLDKKISETFSKLSSMTVSKMDVESEDDNEAGGEFEYGGDAGDGGDGGEYLDFEELVPLEDYGLQQENYLEASGEEVKTIFATDTTDSFLTYFDSRIHQNWAGPEHWKIKRPSLRRNVPTEPKPRPTKKETLIDFNADPIDISSIFAKANPVSITLSKSALEERGTRNNLLPDDLFFSSAELLRLFIKPSWTIGKRRTATTQAPLDRPDLASREVETAYWADPTEIGAPVPIDDGRYDDHDGYNYGNDDEHDDDSLPLPSPELPNIQSINTGDNLVTTFRSADVIDLNYARRAKKVDVQELKRVLWKSINDLPKKSNMPFSKLVSGLDKTELPKEVLQDVSVPYCFICLLHLANEHNLDLQSTDKELLISA